MSTIIGEPIATDEVPDDPRLGVVLRPGEHVRASAVGRADAEPWRNVTVHVTDRRVVWIDDTSGTLVAADHGAVERASFHRFEAPPWPMYFEAEVRPRGGEVVVVRAGEAPRAVEGPVRSGAVHRHVDIVRLRDDDACRLELAVREARDPR